MEEKKITVKVGDEVELVIGSMSRLGVNVLINDTYEGLIFHDDIFKKLHQGARVKGYIKKIREDKKIDVTLERFGYRKVEPNAAKILQRMEQQEGVLHLTDNSNPRDIYEELQMSKKVFKKAVGALYKQRLIQIKKDGIYLTKSSEP